MKVYRFTKENINAYYLSPYVEYTTDRDKTILRNDLFDKIVIAPPIYGDANEVMEKLKNGIKPDDSLSFLATSFNSDDPQKLLDGFLLNGILE